MAEESSIFGKWQGEFCADFIARIIIHFIQIKCDMSLSLSIALPLSRTFSEWWDEIKRGQSLRDFEVVLFRNPNNPLAKKSPILLFVSRRRSSCCCGQTKKFIHRRHRLNECNLIYWSNVCAVLWIYILSWRASGNSNNRRVSFLGVFGRHNNTRIHWNKSININLVGR